MGGDWSDNFATLRVRIDSETEGRYSALRRGLTPRYSVVWRDLLLGWAVVIALCVGLVLLQGALPDTWALVVIPLGSAALGLAFHFIGLFLHEAAHGGLAPSRAANDRLANVFVGALVLSDIRSYRPVHLDHHRFFGSERDTERTYTSRLDTRFVLSTLSGVHTLQVLRGRSSVEHPGAKQRKHLVVPALGALGHLAIVVSAVTFGWWWLAGSWALAVISWFPCFGALRQLLEHRPPLASRGNAASGSLGAYTREFSGHRLNVVFGGAGFTRHLIHHWEPGVSYTRLAELERALEASSAGEVISRRRATYLGTARALVSTGG